MSAELRKRTWNNFTNYLKYQWTGFPPEIQDRGGKLARRFGPYATGYMNKYKSEGKDIAKGVIIGQLRKFPISTPYTGPKAFQPKPKNTKPKTTWADIILSRKEQEQIQSLRNAPSYLLPKVDKKKEKK